MKLYSVLMLLILLTACGGGNDVSAIPCADDNVQAIEMESGCVQLLSTPPVENPRILWILIHGDGSSGSASDGMFNQLSSLAGSDSMAIGLIRPGYFTLDNRRSTGPESDRRFDHYTQATTDYIADAIVELKDHYQPDQTVVVGHSGGAAMTALVSSFYPGLIDKSVLVACPCNVPEWRVFRRGANNWLRSLSPIDYVDQLDPSVPLVAIVGSEDENTYSQLTIDYISLAQTAGVIANYEIIPNRDHNGIINDSAPLISFLTQWVND
ncbi:MAG: pimeloyl-ACP methyl ester carboxylesterase [Cocleimonas sp.]|jgi:pimeloyl-ACP methyl ester carboxylesterase